ncbi:MAG: hypothetical protein GY937_09470 [bacterium]|nr:hypothetical protein [bacterium]
MQPTLVIFIDGLPFDQLEHMPFARTFPGRARLIPGLGYSVNCQTALFTGKTPDELGFWCEWSVSPETSPFWLWRHLFRLLSPLEWFYPAKRVFHKIIDKLAPVSYTKNIPIPYLATFDETGHSVFDPPFDQPSLLDHPQLTKFIHHDFTPGPDRDARIAAAARAFLDEHDQPGSVLLTLVGIDSCSHWEGVGSDPYQKELAENDGYIRELSERFLAKEKDGLVLVVSDHGMTNIETTVSIDLEGQFGSPALDRYSYFSEATLLRVWIHDQELRGPMAAYLDSQEGIERLTEAGRDEFGLTNESFGDLIYHTPETIQIVPSFWGPKPSRGMHGHHPRYRGQHGICLSSDSELFGDDARARDFYRVLAARFESDSVAAASSRNEMLP